MGDRPAAGGAKLGVGPVGGGKLEPGGGRHIMPRRLVRGRGEAGVPQSCAEQHSFVAGERCPHLFIEHEQSGLKLGTLVRTGREGAG